MHCSATWHVRTRRLASRWSCGLSNVSQARAQCYAPGLDGRSRVRTGDLSLVRRALQPARLSALATFDSAALTAARATE